MRFAPRTAGIICGRLNCRRCTRWRLTTDYTWKWRVARRSKRVPGRPPRSPYPTIETVCQACRRQEARDRYAAKSAAEKRALGIAANARARKRRQRQEHQLVQLKATVAHQRTQLGWEESDVPLLPLRMWLLEELARRKLPITTFADQIKINHERIHQLLDGYYWESDCHVIPVATVKLKEVDRIFTSVGHPELLDIFYPYVEPSERG